MAEKEKIMAYIDKLLEKYPKNYYLLMVAEFIDSLQEEPVSDNLEEVAHQYYEPNDTFMDGFKKGANWKEKQIMKEAVDGQLENGDDYLRIKCLSMGCQPQDDGKFVKLIIIKED